MTTDDVTLSNTQRSYRERPYQKVKSSLNPQYAEPGRGCERTSHPSGSMHRKGCQATTLACFGCGLIGHMDWVCQRPKKESANRWTTSTSKQKSHVLTTKVYTEDQNRMVRQFGQSKRRGKVNLAQTKAVPGLIWNGSKFRAEKVPDPSLSLNSGTPPCDRLAFAPTKSPR